jgi:hypothetical protein
MVREMRELLYKNIMDKELGWFDNRDYSPGALTGILA